MKSIIAIILVTIVNILIYFDANIHLMIFLQGIAIGLLALTTDK